MSGLVVDTHAAVWLLLDSPRLSPVARAAMDKATANGESLFLASISLVEIIYLVESGRIPPDFLARTLEALDDDANPLVLAPLDLSVSLMLQSIPRADVPEMPDRIIAATALALDVPLVTRDSRLRATALRTIW